MNFPTDTSEEFAVAVNLPAPPSPAAVHESNRLFVTQAYHDLVDRDPGAEELAFWGRLLEEGVPRDRVFARVAQSTAAHAKVVRELYANLLQRPATEEDIRFWDAFLAVGSV